MENALSGPASNACMYATYGVFLLIGIVVAYFLRKRGEFYSSQHVRKGLALSLNFLATGLGSTVLTTYPQAAAMSGLHGVLVYALATALPLFAFAWLGPRIRKVRPDGFVLTEWVRWRYGTICGFVFSACTVVTIYLFAGSELSNLQYGVIALTGTDGKVPLYVEAAVVAIYLAQGGFGTSFYTDNIQAVMFLVLVVVAAFAMGFNFNIDRTLVESTGLLKPTLMGWKMLYFLMVESFTNDCLLAGFWLRTFAAENSKELLIGCSIASFILFIICAMCGVAGLLAVWSGLVNLDAPNLYRKSEYAFFEVLLPMPSWVHGFVLVLLVSLSTCTFDSYTSSLVTTISNDIFRNRVRMIHNRILTFALMIPIVAIALKSPNILSICDLLACAIVPVLFLGLFDRFYWLSGLEIIFALFGGVLAVFIFGCVYYGNAAGGGNLVILQDKNGIYQDDWGPFGIFVASPIGSYLGASVAFFIRWVHYWRKRKRIGAVFDRDIPHWDHYIDEFVESEWYKIKLPRIWWFFEWFFLIPDGKSEGIHQHKTADDSSSTNKLSQCAEKMDVHNIL